jgi:hypothetical protein
MTQHHSIIAYIATLVAVVLMVAISAWLAAYGRYSEALGVGGAVTGLIGVLGTFRPKQSQEPPQ